MTKARAVYLLSIRTDLIGFRFAFKHEFCGDNQQFYIDGITVSEDAYIKMIWSLMNRNTSYYDAVVKIAEGI